jgi:hypothetical protein
MAAKPLKARHRIAPGRVDSPAPPQCPEVAIAAQLQRPEVPVMVQLQRPEYPSRRRRNARGSRCGTSKRRKPRGVPAHAPPHPQNLRISPAPPQPSAGTPLDDTRTMVAKPSLTAALAELTTQHAALRAQIAHCEQLADQLDAGLTEPAVLLTQITTLRRAFDTHNQLEERMLHPLLLDADWHGAVGIARMVDDHIEEHQLIRRSISPELGPTTTAALRDVLTNLRDHLATEERGWLARHRAPTARTTRAKH